MNRFLLFILLVLFSSNSYSRVNEIDCSLARDIGRKEEFKKWINSQKTITDKCSGQYSLVTNAMNGDMDNVKLLFKKGISPTGKDSNDGEYYLFWAGMSSSDDLLLFLLQRSDPIELSQIVGLRSKFNKMTLMDYAVARGYENSRDFLLHLGAPSKYETGNRVCLETLGLSFKQGAGYCGIIRAIHREKIEIEVTEVALWHGSGYTQINQQECTGFKDIKSSFPEQKNNTIIVPTWCVK